MGYEHEQGCGHHHDLEDTAAEGGVMPGFLFDTAVLNIGCLVPTELGERALEG